MNSYTENSGNNSAKSNKALSKLSKASKGTLGSKLSGETTTQAAKKNGGKHKPTTVLRGNLPNPGQTFKLHPTSVHNATFNMVKKTLIKWVNGILAKRRLQITDITNDLADGLILACILEELTGEHVVEWATTTSEKGKGIHPARDMLIPNGKE